MIEDKKIGLKVATKKESLWIKVRDNTKTRVEQLREDLEIAEEFLKAAEKKVILEGKK